jgi:F0F1-type ATP synthase membrane subunit b/b'
MTLTFLSFFLNNEEAFLEINSNFLETNIINIFLLLGLLIYAYKVSFSVGLKERQNEIIQTIENSQNDVLKATNYYFLAENGFSQSLFWLQSWKTLYDKEKIEIVESKYKQVKTGLEETFLTTENLILNFEKKAFLSLQRYILFLTTGRLLRKFLLLSEAEQAKVIENTISSMSSSISVEGNKK